jgi:hypothetical protein
MRRLKWLLSTALLTGCASAPKLPNSQMAAEQFSTLPYHDKWVARNFYDLGAGDAIKRLYWAQRASQQYGSVSQADPAAGLQRRYINVPIPEHVEPDGTIKEAANQVVEVVQ